MCLLSQERTETMSLENLKKRLLNIFLMLAMITSASLSVKAGDCYPFDRPSGDSNAAREKPQGEDAASEPCPGPIPTPEPITMLLFGAGLISVGYVARLRKKNAHL